MGLIVVGIESGEARNLFQPSIGSSQKNID